MKKIQAKILCAFLSVVLLFSGFTPLAVKADDALPCVNGVYEIKSVDDFNAFRTDVVNHVDFTGKTILLMNDLDMGTQNLNVIAPDSAHNLNSGYYFNGTFDGQGHKIF